MNQKERYIGVFITVTLAYSLFLAHFHTPYFNRIWTREDGIVEWMTVLALVFGALLSFYRAINLRSVKPWYFIGASAILGFLFIFGAGEEISWGQRLLSVKSPEFFLKNNSQGETNLHNLILGGVRINKIIFGLFLSLLIAAYLLAFPWLYKKYQKISSFADAFALPVPRIHHVIFFIAVFVVAQATMSFKKGEILECCGCWTFFMMWLNPLNHKVFLR